MQRLSSVSILVPSYAEGLRFFVDTLGFDLICDIDEGHKRWVKVAPRGAETAFILAQASTPEQVAAIGRQCGGRVWLILQTDDFARDHAAYLDAGVQFEEAPRSETYGTVAVFRDPFGNRWDLIEFSGQ
ncbi:VOC family protein [Pseudooctadecabacter sp.]|uniref:VOC family protein n=1 Tax=Pseudooctadecabacter sp. TaxID=1966338 RepID=UPI0025E0BE44|nr:VOC family protein [Pseudooctadecabacter sp.]